MVKLGFALESFIIYTVLFVILFYLLNKFLIVPLQDILAKRQDEIDKGLKLTNDMQNKIAKIDEDHDAKLKEASKEVKVILEKAKKQADESRKIELEKAKKDADELVKKTQKKLDADRDKLKGEIKDELADIVTDAVEKIVKENVSDSAKQKIVDEAIDQI